MCHRLHSVLLHHRHAINHRASHLRVYLPGRFRAAAGTRPLEGQHGCHDFRSHFSHHRCPASLGSNSCQGIIFVIFLHRFLPLTCDNLCYLLHFQLVPDCIQASTSIGIGLITALAGATELGLVVRGKYTIVDMGQITDEVRSHGICRGMLVCWHN